MRENLNINQRTFNENEILGNFRKDGMDHLVSKEEIVRRNYRDIDGNLVNSKGYVISEQSGAIRSKYTYEDMFIGEYGTAKNLGEIPMPYKLERHNFNPHKILGCFDYDEKKNNK